MKLRPLALAFVLVAGLAHADDPPAEPTDPASLFHGATDALVGQRPAEAIAKLEALSDRGVVDPVLSFDRGLAYANRVRAQAAQPGDLGRAAQGFEEARDLTRDATLERDSSRALSAVRAEIAKRRARAGDPIELEHGQSLGRAIVSLLPENVWAILAAIASVVLTIGLIIRARAKEHRARVAANTTSAIAVGVLAACAITLYSARDARLHLKEGVVVATSRLLDARHVALDGVAPVAEGARVTLLDESSDFAHVMVGRVEGWLPSPTILPLTKR